MSRWGIAMCFCGEPLVLTLAFRKHEFYCLSCGRQYGFLGPVAADETPELLARMEAAKAEWETLSDGLLSDGGMHTDCQTCTTLREPHQHHATPEEHARHEAALERIRTRAQSAPARAGS